MTVMQLRNFVEIAKEQNITRAAEKLFISQQALSKSIRQLESEWDVNLFLRADTGVKLTLIGKKVLPAVEILLRQYDQNEKIISTILESNRYTLTILYEAEQLLAVLPYEFFGNIGNMNILTRRMGSAEQCIEEVKQNKHVMALITGPVKEPSLSFRSILQGEMMVIMPKGHPLEKKETIRLKDLQTESHIWLTGSQNYTSYYAEACIKRGFYPRFALEYPSAEMCLKAVAAGKGISIGPPGEGLLHLENEEEVLVRKPLREEDLIYTAGFVFRKEDEQDPMIRSFLKAVIDINN